MKIIRILFCLCLLPSILIGQVQDDERMRLSALQPALKPFYHGVASGDPLENRVVIWTRVTPEEEGLVEVVWEIAETPGFTSIVQSGKAYTDASKDYTIKVDVGSLQPDRYYYYRFKALGFISMVGRTKTTPTATANPPHLRFAVVSCANYQHGYYNAYERIAERNDLDAVIHLGDYIYEYEPGTYANGDLTDRAHEPEREIVSESDYRTRYSLYRLDQQLQMVHQQQVFIAIWDDHESTNDSYRDGAENHQANEGEWETRKNIARKVYYEWMPVREDNFQLYRSFSYGNLAEVFMLETRLSGRDAPPANFDDEDTPQRRMISETQFKWLTDGLKNSTARWKLIGNQVLFSDLNVGFGAVDLSGQPAPTSEVFVRATENLFIDNWESYPTQRDAIIDTLMKHAIDNVIILTGDSHASWTFDVSKQPVLYSLPSVIIPQPNPYDDLSGEGYNPVNGDGSYAVEFGTPSITSDNFDEALGTASSAQFEVVINNANPFLGNANYNPHLKWVDLDRHGYFVLNLLADSAQANYYYSDRNQPNVSDEVFGGAAVVRHSENRTEKINLPSTAKSTQAEPAPTAEVVVNATNEANPITVLGVYPNPAQQEVWIQFEQTATQDAFIRLTDMKGQLIWQSGRLATGIQRLRIPLEAIQPGVYLIEFGDTNNRSSRKLIVN